MELDDSVVPYVATNVKPTTTSTDDHTIILTTALSASRRYLRNYFDEVGVDTGDVEPSLLDWWYDRLAPTWSASTRCVYRFRVDQSIDDHSQHEAQAHVPCHRFVHSGELDYTVGHTMKRNVRSLYDKVRSLLAAQSVYDACPCVIIHLLFAREAVRARMYQQQRRLRATTHSFPSCLYVLVKDDATGVTATVSFVALADLVPNVVQWFNNLLSQYEKKRGKSGNGGRWCGSAAVMRGDASLLDYLRIGEDFDDRDESRHVVVVASTTTTTTTSKTVRPFNDLTRFTVGTNPVDAVFRSGYRTCTHDGRVERRYVQLRSADEAATLVRVCSLCRQRLH